MHEVDVQYMQEALSLAQGGLWSTHPNPRVGCVFVRTGKILGRGFHQQAGHAHAEAAAIADAKKQGHDLSGSTCYVTLEPCNHHGRTPPCLDALLAQNIARLVVATTDPNPQMCGQSLEKARQAGVIVDVGCCAEAAEQLNRGFFKLQREQRPFVSVKMAMTLDGRIADFQGQSKWISSSESRDDVHQHRAQAAAILSTSTTVLCDQARLSARPKNASERQLKQPVKIILDRTLKTVGQKLSIDSDADVFILYDASLTPPKDSGQYQYVGLPACGQYLNLKCVFDWLAELGINEVWTECGASLAGSLIEQNLADELILYVAPRLLGQNAKAVFDFAQAIGLKEAPSLVINSVECLGGDIKLTAMVHRKQGVECLPGS